MTRRFTLQLGGRGEVHAHTCELCGDRWPCGDLTCDVDLEHIASPEELALSTNESCQRCLTSFDCPGCDEPVTNVEWQCDTLLEDGTRHTTLMGKCGVDDCGVWIRYLDLDDGRGALAADWGREVKWSNGGSAAEVAADMQLLFDEISAGKR